jgi:HlyD family secretion protein
VQVGQTARFTVDAYPDQEFRGRIAQIRLNALVTQNVVTYPVIIEVPNPDEKLRPKMTANVTIDVATVKDVLRVANAALRFKPDTADVAGGATATGPNGATGEGRRRRPETSSAGGGGGAGTEGAAAAFGRGRGAGGAAGMLGGGGGRRETKSQTVYTLGADKKLTPVQIRTGISDGRFTAVVGGGLKVGDSVVVGMITSKAEGAPPPGSNAGPMGGGQRGPGGGGGGRRP